MLKCDIYRNGESKQIVTDLSSVSFASHGQIAITLVSHENGMLRGSDVKANSMVVTLPHREEIKEAIETLRGIVGAWPQADPDHKDYDTGMNGGDAVDYLCEVIPKIKALLKKIGENE